MQIEETTQRDHKLAKILTVRPSRFRTRSLRVQTKIARTRPSKDQECQGCTCETNETNFHWSRFKILQKMPIWEWVPTTNPSPKSKTNLCRAEVHQLVYNRMRLNSPALKTTWIPLKSTIVPPKLPICCTRRNLSAWVWWILSTEFKRSNSNLVTDKIKIQIL